MKKISRQQQNREITLERKGGLRIPKHAPQKRSEQDRDLRNVMRELILQTG